MITLWIGFEQHNASELFKVTAATRAECILKAWSVYEDTDLDTVRANIKNGVYGNMIKQISSDNVATVTDCGLTVTVYKRLFEFD